MHKRITVVTSSFNQGSFIGETIASVLAQNYPDVEHIVVDGMSTDETPAVLARYPHLRVVREPDQGQADAINKGFRLATGDIFCFLNSDDTLLPGALDRVAREIDPERGRHVVMGRCRFVDERGRYGGIEHPSDFESFRRVLEIWKGHTIPQPAVFWTPEVWKTCGPLDIAEKYYLDYDLFCRFARRYRFHKIDQALATYRLHADSKTVGMTDSERLNGSIEISKRYWGSRSQPLYWQLVLSLARFRFDRIGRGRRLLSRSQDAWKRQRYPVAMAYGLAGGLVGPEVAFYTGIFPRMKTGVGQVAIKALGGVSTKKTISPQTAVYLDRTETWNDGWAGPRFQADVESHGTERTLTVRGRAEMNFIRALHLTVRVNGEEIGTKRVGKAGPFHLTFELPHALDAGRQTVEIRAAEWFVPHRYTRGGDHRPLSWKPSTQSVVLE